MKGQDKGELAIETVPIDSLIENPRNDRIHDREQLEAIKSSLRKFTQYAPVRVRRANRMLIGGHGVWTAAKELGWTALDVIFLDVDQVAADQILLVDNHTFELGRTDKERRAALLAEWDPAVYGELGFSKDEIKSLFEEEEELVIREVETDPVDDQAWFSVRCPLAQQADVLDRLKQLVGEMPDVDLELGTVAA